MTTAFQWIFDRAETISINRRAVVAQTQSRDQSIRTVSRGGQVWRFDVKLPDGLPWTDIRPYIEATDRADRYTAGVVSLSNSGYTSWLSAYRGNLTTTSGISLQTNGTSSATLTGVPGGTTSGKTVLAAGDFIQLGTTGRVYSIAADVVYTGTTGQTVTLNRPVLDANNTYSLRVGPACEWTVYCTGMPDWTIFSRNQVSWSGSFTFVEVI